MSARSFPHFCHDTIINTWISASYFINLYKLRKYNDDITSRSCQSDKFVWTKLFIRCRTFNLGYMMTSDEVCYIIFIICSKVTIAQCIKSGKKINTWTYTECIICDKATVCIYSIKIYDSVTTYNIRCVSLATNTCISRFMIWWLQYNKRKWKVGSKRIFVFDDQLDKIENDSYNHLINNLAI